MYPKNSYLEKRSPSPTFVNISSTPFDYNLPSEQQLNKHHHHNHQHRHHHQQNNKSHGSMKFAKTKAGLVTGTNNKQITTLDQNELIYPEDAYSIEFCMPNDVSCKCPPTISSQTAISTTTIYRNDNNLTSSSRRQKNNKNNKSDIINNRWTRKTTNYPNDNGEHKSSTTQHGDEILNLENYCTPKQLQPPIYDVYSYAYLEPSQSTTATSSQSSSTSVLDQTHHNTLQLHKHHHHHHLHQHKQASTSSTTSTTSSSSSTSFMPIYGCGGGGGPSTSSGGSTSSSTSKSPSRNSIKALLAKSFRNRTTNSSIRSNSASAASANIHSPVTANSPITMEKYTFTTRYGTTENLYEEVNDDKIREILSTSSDQEPSSSTTNQILLKSLPINSKEEQRRVQNNHFRILDELNLSLEALIMPPTPPDISPTTTINNQDNNIFINGSKSVENISSALNNIGSTTITSSSTTSATIDFKENIKERFYKTRNKIDSILKDNSSCSGSNSSATTTSNNSNNGFGDIENGSNNYCYDKRFASTMMMPIKQKHFKNNYLNNDDDNNSSSGGSSNIAMTLISPSSPFKSMKRYFDSGTTAAATATTTSSSINAIQKLSPNDNLPSDIKTKNNNSNNKFWTIRQ